MPHSELLWNRISTCPPVRRLLDTAGVRVTPYYLFLEKLSFFDGPHPRQAPGACEIGRLAGSDLRDLGAAPGIRLPSPERLARLGADELGYVLRCGGEAAGYTWICLRRCESRFGRFGLKPHEAYFFQTSIAAHFRGRNLALRLKCHAYAELKKLGREILYSHVMRFNRPSIRAHEKLNAKALGLWLSVEARRFWVCLPIRNYRLPPDALPFRRPGGPAAGFRRAPAPAEWD